MNYGFIIDNRKCIGCHACSTACKSENEVPLGVYRTWVKYVETGTYPDTRRHFQVTRCNHCANPPCVRICPVTAMYQRHDGIVEFDPSICIGCKACMQACPYDAIHIDPETGTAAKCHYCSHRTEIGLEPACVVVCPEHAIVAGDLDDASTEISRLLATQDVTVRKPEQGTAPKLFYIDGNAVTLHPTATERTPVSFLWADVIPLHATPATNGHDGHGGHNPSPANPMLQAKSGTALRPSQPQGDPWSGPIQFGGRVAEQMVQTSYNAQHKIPWHWPVPTYLVTKGIGTGLFMFLAIGWGLNLFAYDGLLSVISGFATLFFIGLTTLLLVYDLDRPERFLSILLRPQWKSWLTRGAYLLVGFSIVAGLWWVIEAGAYFGFLNQGFADSVRPAFLWLGLPLAMGAALYTAFLFGQAEGRDLWQSPLLPIHLLIQAIMVGSAFLLLMGAFISLSGELRTIALVTFSIALVADVFVTIVGEFGMPHASEVAARAAHDISHGHYRNQFWLGSLGLGHILPAGLLITGGFLGGSMAAMAVAVAAISAIIGLYLFEHAFVMAPQEIPNS